MPQQRTENEVPEAQRTHDIYWCDLLLLRELTMSVSTQGGLQPCVQPRVQGTAVPEANSCLCKELQPLFGHHEGPLHIHHQIIAWRRDAWNHIFYKHLKALPPVDFIWHHLHLGLRRFRAFAFVFKGRRKENLQLSKRTSLMLCFWPHSYGTQNLLWSSSFLHEWHCKALVWCLSKHFK